MLAGGKVVWSAGRSAWTRVLSVMMTPRGVTATHSGRLRRKFRWEHWRRRWGGWQWKGPIGASYYEYNATLCVMLFIKAQDKFARTTQPCAYRRAHSGNYVSWFWSVRCTPLICLWIYQRPVKHVSPPGVKLLHLTAVLSSPRQRRHKSATFSRLHFLRGKLAL